MAIIQSLKYAPAVAPVLIFLLKFLKIIISFNNNKSHITKLNKALKIEFLDKNFKEYITEELKRAHFQRLTGISAEAPFREKIFQLYNNSEGKIKNPNIKKASRFIKFQNGEIIIKITRYEAILFLIHKTVSAISLFTSLILGCIALCSSSPLTIIILMFTIIFLLIIYLCLESEVASYNSAKLIQNELLKIKGSQDPMRSEDLMMTGNSIKNT